MEAKKIYQDSIFLLANLIKNEQLRVELLNDSELKKQAIELINDLLVLEINEKCTFKDQRWSAVFGKALVNITKEKLKFIKPEDKKADNILSDITYLQTYLYNNLQISRDSLTDQNFELTEQFVKEKSKITDKMKEKFLKVSEKKPEPEVVDKSKPEPNTNSQQQSGFGAGTSTAQGNPFIMGMGMVAGMNSIPPSPLQDIRFYPYNTKPKYTKWLKLALGIVLGLSAIFFIVISIVFQVIKPYTIDENLNGLNAFSNQFKADWSKVFNDKKITKVSWYLSNSVGIQTNAYWIIMMIILGLMMGWIIFSIVQPPKTYRQKFIIPAINLIIPGMFLIMMITTFSKAITYIFGANVPYDFFRKAIAVTVKGPMTLENYNKWLEENKIGVENLLNEINNYFDMTMAKVLIWLLFVSILLSAITIIITILLNPRLDRDKIAKANNEYQIMISELMQGRSYEMDPSLYEPQEEIDAFLKSLEDRQNKKYKNKDNQN